MENRLLGVWGEYSATEYTVYAQRADGSDEELYRAGNSAFDSQGYVPAEDGVGIDTMRQFCWQTLQEESSERGLPFLWIQEQEGE